MTTLTCAQVHLQSEGGKGGGGGGKAAAPAVAAAGKKGALVGASTAPLDEEGALRIIQAVITGKPDKAVAEQQLRDAVAKVCLHQSLMNDIQSEACPSKSCSLLLTLLMQVDPNPEGSAKGANLKPVARAAWAAAVLELTDLAEK